jgi:hypothetical protein
MLRLIPLTSILLLLHGIAVQAQDSSFDFRGSVDDVAPLDDTVENAAAEGSARQDPTNSLQNSTPVDRLDSPAVDRLRSSLNEAAAEQGSTGLGTSGRRSAIRPFSDRLAAVRGLRGSQGQGLDDTVFDGETTFDAPRGIRLGTFTILPELIVTGGWTDNAAGSSTGTSSTSYRIAPSIEGTSGWSRHQLDFVLRGSYLAYTDASEDDEPNLDTNANLRLDLSGSTQANFGLAYGLSKESSSSAENRSGDNLVHALSGTAGITRDAGIVSVTLGAGVDRTVYTSDSAGTQNNSRDNTLYSASLRLDGDGGGLLSPFVEGSALLRRFDRLCNDAICEKRDANGYELRAGFSINAGPKVTGSLGAGWRIESLKDNRLDALKGVVVDGSLVWSPSRLTTVTAGLGTSFEPTDIDTASGSIIYSGDLRLAHAFSDRFVGETGFGYSYRPYQGISLTERTLTGFAGLTYALTRNVALETRYSYTAFDSTNAGSDYTKNQIEAGLRFRH